MVRHEAGEALGAIGNPDCLEILKKYRDDKEECEEVRQTCELAVDRLVWLEQNKGKDGKSKKFLSVDPAPSMEECKDIAKLRSILLDQNLPLFERYRAMFSLRDDGSKEAVDALAAGFSDPSALFRHEIGYVFGQMQSVDSVEALIKIVEKDDENPMVRHEAAEALGSIASDETLPVLKKFAEDRERVVSESCVVALDMYEYEKSGNFQYADTLNTVAN